MDEQERSPGELNQNSQDSEQQTSQNGFIKDSNSKLFLTLNDDETSKTQRTIARARTFSVLRALDSDRKGELIQFLSTAKLIEKNKPIISLKDANLGGANLIGANLVSANLGGANLGGANLGGANLGGANLGGANLEDANLEDANLIGANLGGANLEYTNLGGANLGGANLGGANLIGANLEYTNLEYTNLEYVRGLTPAEVKTTCNWEKADVSEEFKRKLDQEPDQEVDCSRWK